MVFSRAHGTISRDNGVAGDIIRTVVVHPTLDNLIVLAIIVVIRTFLSIDPPVRG